MAGADQACVQLHPTASAEELLGSLSLKALDFDLIARAWMDASVSSHALIIDEFEKASTPVQQALLSMLAERCIRDNGRTFSLPIESLIATSNDDIYDDAVRDRFALTCWSQRTPDGYGAFRRAFRRLRPTQPTGRITSGQLANWRALAERAVDSQDDPRFADIWDAIDGAMEHLSATMSPDGRQAGLSERRGLHLIDLMGAVASSQGRDYILISDAHILQYAPPTEAQQAEMARYLRDTLRITPIEGYQGRYTSSLEHDLIRSLADAQAHAEDAMHALEEAFK